MQTPTVNALTPHTTNTATGNPGQPPDPAGPIRPVRLALPPVESATTTPPPPPPSPSESSFASASAPGPLAPPPTATSVWLCAPRPEEPDPDIPRWASGVITEYAHPSGRVEIRVPAPYAGAAGEAAALLRAAAVAGHEPVAILPTPGLAAQTRALTRAFSTPQLAARIEHPRALDRHRPRVLVDQGDRPPAGPVGLLVVLAGPVRPGTTTATGTATGTEDATEPARPRRRPAVSGRLAGWARGIAPGGTVVLLCPPPRGRSRHPSTQHPGTTGHPGGWVAAAAHAGLRYTQHVVLVHVPVTEDRFAPPGPEPAEPGPFAQVHTDAFVFLRSPCVEVPSGTGPRRGTVSAPRAAHPRPTRSHDDDHDTNPDPDDEVASAGDPARRAGAQIGQAGADV